MRDSPVSHNVSVFERIVEEIATDGPIGFDRFMELALYDRDAGYFAAGRLRSDRSGDFLTSPEVSPLFGTTLARFVDAECVRMGGPCELVEVGGGSGSLLRPLLDALVSTVDVSVVERSPAALLSITERVPEARIIDRAELSRGVLIGNEVLDNMPAAIAIRGTDEWHELVVDVDGALLQLRQAPARSDVAAWADRYAGPVSEGGRVEVQAEATEWVRSAVRRLEVGALVLIDYGDLAEHLEHRRAEGTIRTYQGHHLGPDPLRFPGETDITMDVNFSAVIDVATAEGATVELHRQDDFLAALGLRDQIAAMRASELEAAREGRVTDQLGLKNQIIEAETLLHPRGLGDFRVAVLRK